MESANIHHQLQDQLVVGSPSSSTLATSPNCYGAAGTAAHACNLNSFMNTNGLSASPSENMFLNSRQHQENTTLLSPRYSSMAPDLGFHWANNTAANFNINQSAQDLQLSRIKEELSDNYYLKYTEILNSSSPSSSCSNDDLTLHRSNGQRNLQHSNDNDNYNMGSKFLLKSSSSGNLMNKIQLSPGDLYGAAANCGRGFSQIFPSINIPSLNQGPGMTNSINPGSLDMNLQALDLLTSSRFGGGCFGPSSQNQIGLLRDAGFSYDGFHHMQQSHQMPSNSSSKISALSSNGSATEGKRASSKLEPKAIQTSAPKKSRLEARASCPPFKVRKEKLGDRIAALQQLVAPFGKTDTASVLMEAIGYIKFLQSQVETLSVPYMKTSRNKPSRVSKGGVPEIENEESKRDLKSRGLCLVPLSCLSYIVDGGSAAVWPPPHFGGSTG